MAFGFSRARENDQSARFLVESMNSARDDGLAVSTRRQHSGKNVLKRRWQKSLCPLSVLAGFFGVTHRGQSGRLVDDDHVRITENDGGSPPFPPSGRFFFRSAAFARSRCIPRLHVHFNALAPTEATLSIQARPAGNLNQFRTDEPRDCRLVEVKH
jgi:hypothetical protein